MTMIDHIAETRILEAQERGDFDDLPGAGQPLALEDEPLVSEELRVAYRILKNAGCLPPELETRREIHDVRQLLAAASGAERSRAVQRLQVLLMRLSFQRGTEVSLETEDAYRERVHERFAHTADDSAPSSGDAGRQR